MVAIDADAREALKALRQPGALKTLLQAHKNRNHIFTMGCGRSGTFLLTTMMSTYRDVSVFYGEVPVEYFGIVDSCQNTIVLKRAANSYETIEAIPLEISILLIVRHPFDVLTSVHPSASLRTGRYYHITPGRWLGETMALRWLIESSRPKTKIVRYEDLAKDPDGTQAEIGSFLNLEIKTSAKNFHRVCTPPPMAIQAMNGLRPPDGNSIGRWRADLEGIRYLRTIQSRLLDCLPWFARTFSYDIKLS